MKTRLKAYLAAALVAVAGVSAWADDAPEEEVVAFGEATLWLGPDEILVASDEGEFWLGPDEILVASDEGEFWLGPEGLSVGEGVWLVVTDLGAYIVGEGAATGLPEGFDRDSVRNVVVGDGVTSIGPRFFKKCYRLDTITGGRNLVSIGERAFYLCLSLESITIDNPAFELDCLKDSIIYQMAFELNTGKFIMIPDVRISGCAPVLYGKASLADSDWTCIGPLGGQNLKQLKEGGVYHFFQTRLEKAGD